MSLSTHIAVMPRASTVPGDKRARILIVDNDEDVLIALERTLEDEGYATVTAASHEEASQLLSQRVFDCLVLDDYLSDKDSIGVLMELRRLDMVPPAVVVTYNRYPAHGIQVRLRLLGVKALIEKCAHGALVQTIRELLGREWPRGRIGSESPRKISSDAQDEESEFGMFLLLAPDCPRDCQDCHHAGNCRAYPLY